MRDVNFLVVDDCHTIIRLVSSAIKENKVTAQVFRLKAEVKSSISQRP